MNEISKRLSEHYTSTFKKFGPTPQGVDWSNDGSKVLLRFKKITDVIIEYSEGMSILDVGCGYGSLFDYLKRNNKSFKYLGVDLSQPMINYAKDNFSDAEWVVGDFLEIDFPQNFDYVVCNGILTQKLMATEEDMLEYSKLIIERMFRLCKFGISFNIMSKDANFFVDNLFYQDPSDFLKWCRSSISKNVIVDQSYKLHEFTTYIYR